MAPSRADFALGTELCRRRCPRWRLLTRGPGRGQVAVAGFVSIDPSSQLLFDPDKGTTFTPFGLRMNTFLDKLVPCRAVPCRSRALSTPQPDRRPCCARVGRASGARRTPSRTISRRSCACVQRPCTSTFRGGWCSVPTGRSTGRSPTTPSVRPRVSVTPRLARQRPPALAPARLRRRVRRLALLASARQCLAGTRARSLSCAPRTQRRPRRWASRCSSPSAIPGHRTASRARLGRQATAEPAARSSAEARGVRRTRWAALLTRASTPCSPTRSTSPTTAWCSPTPISTTQVGARASTAAVVSVAHFPLALLRPALDPSRKTVADIISLEHGDARARFQAVVGAIAARYASNPACVAAWLGGVRA
jgi:hypothetical protein